MKNVRIIRMAWVESSTLKSTDNRLHQLIASKFTVLGVWYALILFELTPLHPLMPCLSLSLSLLRSSLPGVSCSCVCVRLSVNVCSIYYVEGTLCASSSLPAAAAAVALDAIYFYSPRFYRHVSIHRHCEIVTPHILIVGEIRYFCRRYVCFFNALSAAVAVHVNWIQTVLCHFNSNNELTNRRQNYNAINFPTPFNYFEIGTPCTQWERERQTHTQTHTPTEGHTVPER